MTDDIFSIRDEIARLAAARMDQAMLDLFNQGIHPQSLSLVHRDPPEPFTISLGDIDLTHARKMTYDEYTEIGARMIASGQYVIGRDGKLVRK